MLGEIVEHFRKNLLKLNAVCSCGNLWQNFKFHKSLLENGIAPNQIINIRQKIIKSE